MGSPGYVGIQHHPFVGQEKLGAVTQQLFSKRNSIRHKTHPVPCRINEDSPKTAIIYLLSFFNAVAGENSSVPAHCPEICCAKANKCSTWQAEKAPRCLMDERSSPKQRGVFVRS